MVLFSFMSIHRTSGLVRRLSQSATCMQEIQQWHHGIAQIQAKLVLNVRKIALLRNLSISVGSTDVNLKKGPFSDSNNLILLRLPTIK